MSVYIEQNHHNNFSQCLPSCEQSFNNPIIKAIKTVAIWKARSHQRRQLALLDSRMLEDIGLTTNDVRSELAKPFWK